MFKDFKFIEKPNLPQNKICHCVISENATEAIKFLNDLGIKTLLTEKSVKLDDEIAFHSDTQFLYCGKKTALIAPNQVSLGANIERLGCRVEVAEFEPFSPYPDDILLNQTFLNELFVGNLKFASEKALNFAKTNKMMLLNTKQGYSKCSICIINEKAIITEDNGMATLLKNSQVEVLKIKPDYIQLSDKHSGFLGGASGKISKNEIFFNGNIEEHPDFKVISDFLNRHNVKPVYDKSYKLTDIGSIIPITEKIN